MGTAAWTEGGSGLFKSDAERLWFDVNVALLSVAHDMETAREESVKEVRGSVTNRRQARAVAELARRQVDEMERGEDGAWSVRPLEN